ncbi:MAG: cytochrome b/b6 domain-containing protein [Vicinamibacterales bacterium]
MDPFRYAKNFYSNDALPQQLTWEFAILLLSLVAVMAGVVLIRRAFGYPRRSSTGALPPPGVAAVERYEIGARLWHVGVFGLLVALGFSGLAFFAPGSVFSPLPFGLTWLYAHLILGALFIFGAVFHAIKASYVDFRSMLFNREDWHELVANTRYYLGRRYELPKLGKYGIWNKLFHVALILLALTMIVSGIILSLDTLGWAQIDQNTHRQQRLLHDVGSYGFLTLIPAHVFWLFFKKRTQLKAMVTGTIAADTFSSNHDWNRWKPHVVARTSGSGKVDHGK